MSFKYINKGKDLFDADDADDLQANTKQLEAQLKFYQNKLHNPSKNQTNTERIEDLLQLARVENDLYKKQDAWNNAFLAFTIAEKDNLWQLAVEACDVLFLTEGPDSLVALGHALWLGITFPIDPELTVAILQHLVDESPNESETKAVAATVAHYIATTRCKDNSDLTFFTSQLLASVADNHSRISDQKTFDVWHRALELNNSDVFLKKLSHAINQLIGDKWWVNKEDIYKQIDSSSV